MRPKKLGFDFDGVFSDCGQLKSDGARELFNKDIPAEKFKKELVVDSGILTASEYKYLQQQVYGTREIGLKMLPVDGVLEIVPRLQREGHELSIITARGGFESEIALEWMSLMGIKVPLLGIGGGVSKADACRGLDVYIDDDMDKLIPLVRVVPNRYLFSWGYNRHIEMPSRIGKRIESWQHFYEEISSLSKSSPQKPSSRSH